MKITITPTEKLISTADLDRAEFPRLVRAWEGVTDQGVRCTILVSGVAVANTERQEEFEKSLREFVPRDKQIFDLRHIL